MQFINNIINFHQQEGKQIHQKWQSLINLDKQKYVPSS